MNALEQRDLWGIDGWNTTFGAPRSFFVDPRLREQLIRRGESINCDWDCIWHPAFTRLALINRPWTRSVLVRMTDKAAASNRWDYGMAARYFQHHWHFGIVIAPLVTEAGGPRGLRSHDITQMLSLVPGIGESPLEEKDGHNERLDASYERGSRAREDDIGKFFDKGYRYSNPSSMPEYICKHNRRSRGCPVCNPKSGYVGSVARKFLDDRDARSIARSG